MSEEQSILETIQDIIERDIKRIAQRSKDDQLDRVSASNLVEYAKLQIACEKHEKAMEEAAANEKIQGEEYAAIRAQAEALLKARGK